jgi:hypothetical protein
MPMDRDQVLALEEGLDEAHISQVRFGRSRFLRKASLAFFGAAAGLFAAQREAEAAPPGCQGAPACNTCYDHCRCHRCRRRAYSCGGNHCWRTRYNGRCILCCDFIDAFGDLCICRCYC